MDAASDRSWLSTCRFVLTKDGRLGMLDIAILEQRLEELEINAHRIGKNPAGDADIAAIKKRLCIEKILYGTEI